MINLFIVWLNTIQSFSSFLSLHTLLSSLFSIQTQTPSLLSLPSLLGPLFGSLVVVRGWVVGPVFGSWVMVWVSSGCGFWRGCGLWSGSVFGSWSWIGELGWSGSLVVDRRVGMKWVVGRGSMSWDEVGRWLWIGSWSGSLVVGRGWVVAEVAPVMIFFEWVCSGGFQIDWVSNRRRGFQIDWVS